MCLARSLILRRIDELERTVLTFLERIERELKTKSLSTDFFDHALEAYKNRWRDEFEGTHAFLGQWLSKIRDDQDLAYPHRKIVEYLLSQFDHVQKCFQQVHFSKLVKGARIGKQAANRYLKILIAKQYITCIRDGYRVFYRINEGLLERTCLQKAY